MNTSAEINHSGQGHADAHKSPERLEQEVNQTRARIEDRLLSLTSRLSPGELLDQALGMAREHGGEFGHNLGSQVKQNPVPLVLTGIGLAWLMLGSRNSGNGAAPSRRQYANGSEYADASEYSEYGGVEYAGEYPRGYSSSRSSGNANDSGSSMFGKVKDALGGITGKAHDISERAHHTAERVGERAHEAADRVHDVKDAVEGRVHRASAHLRDGSAQVRARARTTQHQLSDFFRDQPILAGGLGVALGAALGALLPPTETEDKLMGRTSADALAKAKAAANEKFAGARAKVSETAKDTVATLKQNLNEIKDEVQSAVSRPAESGSPDASAPENSAQNNPSAF